MSEKTAAPKIALDTTALDESVLSTASGGTGPAQPNVVTVPKPTVKGFTGVPTDGNGI